ncbi:MAG: RNA polymerase sigma-70 factor [Williamsia sp.]|nr:RNA polymerase sigma-70 factor [Williamsia sp.]
MLANTSYNSNYLVRQVATGDEDAFRQLFYLYWDNIYSVAFTFIRSQVVAEELVQDIFLKVWIKREQLLSVDNFDNYLFIIARNHIYNELRKKTGTQPLPAETENNLSPDQQLLLKETGQIIDEAVKQLPPQQRTVFELSRYEGLDQASIASRMGVSRLTVKSHMNKALHFIRAYLSRHNILLPEILLPFVACLFS